LVLSGGFAIYYYSFQTISIETETETDSSHGMEETHDCTKIDVGVEMIKF